MFACIFLTFLGDKPGQELGCWSLVAFLVSGPARASTGCAPVSYSLFRLAVAIRLESTYKQTARWMYR